MGTDGSGDTPGEGRERAGIDEARRRIAEAARTNATMLDIGGLGLTQVPKELYGLGQLKVLYLGAAEGVREKPYFALTQADTKKCNAVSALPPAFFTSLRHLTHLHLEHNQLTGLPDEVAALTGLTSLNLWGNQIGADGARAIAALTGLTSLDLGNNKIGDDGARAIAALTGLTSLNLWGNQIGDDGARAIAALTGLTSLNLWSNQIGDDGARAIAALTGLTSLNLWGNQIGDDGARAIAALTGLTSLNLWGNQIGADGARAIAALTGLTSLDLGNNQIGADGARAIAALTGLTSLDLWSNQIGADGARAIAALTGLTSLDLWCNQIGADGARAIAALTGLTSLNLWGNQIGDDGARAIAALTGLTSLNLGGNQIGADGARAIAALTGLTSLDLRNNQIGDDEPFDLSPFLGLTKLTSFQISGCRAKTPITPIWSLPNLTELVLYDCVLPGIPAEVLSKKPYSSCLESLRAHFADLEAGEEEITEVKFMILGNGRAGKTQICRRLRGEEYDERQNSTHGVQISSARLALSPSETVTLKIWDFGGQDIYHGTHALFLKSRAIFPVVWTPESEEQKYHQHGGFTFRNEPLGYWLAYVRRFGGAESPVLVIQSQCDRPEDEKLFPRECDDLIARFPFKKQLHFSARTDNGLEALSAALRDAVRWMREKRGADVIGTGRATVKAEMERLYADDQKLITQKRYRALCKKVGNVSSPELLLDYLHNIGTVFYRRGLFNDAIILDQAWALDAVYAVFDRESKAFKNIGRHRGRFSRADLAEWGWQKHDIGEQELFLSFMQQCGICFTIRDGYGDVEAEYIAPDLLPGRDDREIADQLQAKWDDHCDAEATLTYDLLPPGLMRSLISKIGAEAGLAAEYWRGGFYFYDEKTGSRALVEQHWERQGWSGEIRVQTQRGQADVLLQRVLAFIDERHEMFGARPRPISDRLSPGDRISQFMAGVQGRGHMTVSLDTGPEHVGRTAIKPGHEPSEGVEYYISYKWGDEFTKGHAEDAEIDRLCAAARKYGAIVMRDKAVMNPGDRISEFMARIGRAPRVIIVLGDKYLRSSYCMAELFDVRRNCKGEAAEFIARTRMYVRDCAKIGTLGDRTGYLLYWREKKAEFDALVKAHGHDILAGDDLADYRRMQTFLSHLPDMLRLVQDVLRPITFDDFISYAFDDPSTR